MLPDGDPALNRVSGPLAPKRRANRTRASSGACATVNGSDGPVLRGCQNFGGDGTTLDSRRASYVYDGFASYATDPDGNLVRAVETLLEGFHRRPDLPPQTARQIELCVDGRDFVFPKRSRSEPIDAIGPVVRAYQGRSRSLIVFCGPLSREHPWIKKEIEWWIEDRPGDPIYFALTHGANPDKLPENMPAPLVERGGGDNVIFFDLRGFYVRRQIFFHSRGRRGQVYDEAPNWRSVRQFHEEVAKLAATLVSDATGKAIAVADLVAAYADSERRAKRRRRLRQALGVLAMAVVIMVASIWLDRVAQTRQTIALSSKAEAAIDDQQYERAMRIGLQGLPVSGQYPWALGWTDSEIIALETKLAGAIQLSSLIAQLNESGPVRTASFSPDGTKIVTAVEDGTASVWDMRSMTKIATCARDDVVPGEYRGQPPWFMSSQFSGDGNRIVTASHDKVAWIWGANAPTCKDRKDRVLLEGHRAAVSTAAFDPGGKHIVTSSEDGTTIIWDASTGKPLQPPREWNHKLSSAEFSPDGTTIVVSAWDGFVAIADVVHDGRVRVVLQDAVHPSIWSARFSRNGKYVVTASADGSVVVYDANSGAVHSFLPRQAQPVNSAAFGNDDDYIITSSADNTARMWDIKDSIGPAQRFVFQGHSKSVRHVEFNSNGDRIVSSSSDGKVRIWDAATNIKPILLGRDGQPAHKRSIRSIEYSADDKLFVTTSDDQTAKIWKIEEGGRITNNDDDFTWSSGGLTSAAFSPDGKHIVMTTTDGKALLWDATKNSQNIFYRGSITAAASAQFSRDGKLIVTSSEQDGIQVWDAETVIRGSAERTEQEPINSFKDAAGSPIKGARSAEFALDGKRVLTGSDDGIARLWDVQSGLEVMSFKGHTGVVLSAHYSGDGKRIVSASSDRTARVWEVGSGKEIMLLLGSGGDIYGARFSADGTRIVTASGDHKVRVWDTQTGAQMLRFDVSGDPYDVAFTKDGRRIIVAVYDGNLQLFDVPWTLERRETLVSRACREKLADTQLFTLDDAQDPILALFRGTNPCQRAGPLISLRSAVWRAISGIFNTKKVRTQ
jgi:WD40 repeat protein